MSQADIEDQQTRMTELEAENAALKARDCELVDGFKKISLAEHTAQHRIKELREALEKHARYNSTKGTRCVYCHCLKGYEHSKDCAIGRVLSTPDNTAEFDTLVRDAERWNYVLSITQITDAMWKALPTRITQQERHINNAIDAATKEST